MEVQQVTTQNYKHKQTFKAAQIEMSKGTEKVHNEYGNRSIIERIKEFAKKVNVEGATISVDHNSVTASHTQGFQTSKVIGIRNKNLFKMLMDFFS